MVSMARKHLIPDRIRRVWRIVEDIALEPGKGRKQIAEKYAMSERQVQADLNLIRSDMHLPLIRKQGYRFEAPRNSVATALSMREAQLLLLAVRHLGRDRPAFQRELASLLRKLPSLFPPHLRLLADQAIDATVKPRSPRADDRRDEDLMFATLTEAAVRRRQVQLHYPPNDPASPIRDPIVRAELLVPYGESWYLIGQCQQKDRLMMFNLETVTAVTPLFRM